MKVNLPIANYSIIRSVFQMEQISIDVKDTPKLLDAKQEFESYISKHYSPANHAEIQTLLCDVIEAAEAAGLREGLEFAGKEIRNREAKAHRKALKEHRKADRCKV